jgi:hypothetical protein
MRSLIVFSQADKWRVSTARSGKQPEGQSEKTIAAKNGKY